MYYIDMMMMMMHDVCQVRFILRFIFAYSDGKPRVL